MNLMLYDNCCICPRNCGVDRNKSTGYCGEGAELRLAFAGLHSGEEPPLSGEKGSGTIFVSGCNMRCHTCQNWQISGGVSNENVLGRVVSTEEFIKICLELQKMGAENINIVTGSHVVPAIAQKLKAAKINGLTIPVVWNSSGYEKPETLELLDGLVDIWLPDLKTLDKKVAATIFKAPDYPEIACAAIHCMIKNNKTIIRHLILPGKLEATKEVLRWIAFLSENYAAGTFQLSLMTQYTPILGEIKKVPGTFLNGTFLSDAFLSEREYDTVMGWLNEFGIDEGFCQELVTGSDWLPDFRRKNPFSSSLSVPVWHY